MSQFDDNVLIKSIIDKLPITLAKEFENLILKAKMWSEDWEKAAKNIVMELNCTRDKKIISKSEFSYLHSVVFHSFGKIGSSASNDFFRFYTGI